MSLAEAAPLKSGQDNPAPAVEGNETKKDGKKRRSLFGLGKKKSDSQETSKSASKSGTMSPPSISRDTSKLTSVSQTTRSPSQSDAQFSLPTSPNRGMSSSPRLSSPAGSQIFERDVQESAVLPTSPAIPSHIQTENHIPPVLDASSEAITDNKIDPDNVEILTHNAHMPASVAVTGAPLLSYEQMASQWAEELGYKDQDDVSNFGSLDSTDVRRLSFISFADVVQSEHGVHAPGNRESMHLAGLTSLSQVNRSPSPIRSPVSSQGPGTSPPTSKSGSVKGLEMSPSRKPIGSPTLTHHSINPPSEINVETMSQALRRTGSSDLSGARSHPTSPVDGPSR